MFKKFITTLCVILMSLVNLSYINAQAPYISSIDKTSAAFGETLLIFGNNFPSLANTQVKFGGANATVISASSVLIEVTVPSNATTDNITVTNTATGEIAYSNEVFFLSFGGNDFSTDNFAAAVKTASGGNQTYDICACDFNADGKTDVATTNQNSNNINIYTNNSTINTVSFSKTDISLGIESINTTCGDLNGDGKPDLVVTRGGGGNEIYIYTNTSTDNGAITFNPTRLVITTPNDGSDIRGVRRVAINDIDLDGLPDLVVSIIANNTIDIYKNNGTIASIGFDPNPSQYEITGAAQTVGLDVKDLNNDGLPDIVLSGNQAANFYVLQNQSEPGTIAFLNSTSITVSGLNLNLKLADLDNDGDSDIALTDFDNNSVKILNNSTTGVGGTITFDSEQEITGVNGAWGLDFADFEGDGDLDIAVASTVNGSGQFFYTLINDGNGNFTRNQINNGVRSQNVKIFDVDGDSKPDIAYTQFNEGQMSVLLNKNCITPRVSPAQAQTVCPGTNLRFQATQSAGATYQWKLDGADIIGATNSFFDYAGTGGDYSVVMSAGVECEVASNSVTITVDPDAINPVTAGNNIAGESACEGTPINLTATNIAGATYSWTGPNGYTSTDQNPALTTSATADLSGKYIVVAQANGCTSAPDTTTVVVVSLPVIIINNDNQDTFCTGNSVNISVTDFGNSYTYGWKLDDAVIVGETATTLTATTAGAYAATISANMCVRESPSRTLSVISPSVADFSTDATNNTICINSDITFDASTSTGDGGTLAYNWNFGDTNTDIGITPTHPYTTPGTYTVILTTSFSDVTNCTNDTHQVDITITDIPVVDITSTGGVVNTNTGVLEKCPSDEIALSIGNQYTEAVWSNADTGNNIDVQTIVANSDSYTVSATDEFGCSFTSNSIEIGNFPSSGIDIISSTNMITTERTIVLSEDQKTVELTVENATANTIAWTPSNYIEDTTLITVDFFVQEINTLVTVLANDAQGCTESDTVRIINESVRFKKSFSPNGDGIGDDCWEISNSRGPAFSDCKIFIFDNKGSLIKEANGPFDLDCVWDGNLNGSQAPEGVYYYALKCDTEGLSKSGAILLAR